MPGLALTGTSISISSCCSLASEVWRLGRYIESLEDKQEVVSLRYSLRQLSRVLDELEVAIIDLTGSPYDAGMIQEVVEVVDDPALAVGEEFVAETITPTVTLKQSIVQTGQITLRRSPFSNADHPEVRA